MSKLISILRLEGISPKTRSQVQNLLLSGPSPSQRKIVLPNQLWLEVTGAAYMLKENPQYYSNLLQLKNFQNTSFLKQIQADLYRTFINEYQQASPPIDSLRRVLIAYAIRNPSVGYCQGLNFIVGRLLNLEFSQEQAFWMLCQIIEIYLPVDYFSLMEGILIDQKVFDFILSQRLPKVYDALQALFVDVSLYSVQWFICIFAYSFPRTVSIRIWDVFFVQGDNLLMSIALSILYLNQKKLTTITELDQALKEIEKSSQMAKDPELVLETARKKQFRLTKQTLFELRMKFKAEVEQQLDYRCDEVIPEKILMRTISLFCQSEDECQQKIRRTSSYFSFNNTRGINIRENYIDDECIPKFFDTTQLRNVQEGLLLGQKNHVCSFERIQNEEKQDLSNFIAENRVARLPVSIHKSFSYNRIIK